MKKTKDQVLLSATDLSNYIACRHKSSLDLSVANGLLKPPTYRDPALDILQQRGLEFEKAYLDHLKSQGLIVELEETDTSSIDRTIKAMQQGVDYIYQASLASGPWQGKADFLRKVDKPSRLGNWSYEVIDSKLAKETRAGTILQICLYSEMVEEIQGVMPEFMHVMIPGDPFRFIEYRLDDFIAYHRFVKHNLLADISNGIISGTYPNPVEHCDICRWWQYCDKHRRSDDHLSYVAGMSTNHIRELTKWGVERLETLAKLPLPIEHIPSRGSIETYVRVREQARVQQQSRSTNLPVYELLDLHPEQGLSRLPAPSAGDIFFDFESDPFVGTTGLEYLFGWVSYDKNGETYKGLWALSAEQEKQVFEDFMDDVMKRWKAFPDMHIYHFTAYEPSALKRLMGKYATREYEIDQLLRAGIFIDLHSIAKQSLRAGIERYSLKELEVLHGFERTLPLTDASHQLRTLDRFLETNNAAMIPQEVKAAVEWYNKEDCLSTGSLRNWLEKLRGEMINAGHSISRPAVSSGEASESLTEHQQRIKQLYEQLAGDLSLDRDQRDKPQQARWLLANMLDWYRREKKSTWWEYFRLLELPDADLFNEKAAISALQFTNERTLDKKSVIDTYKFPEQECDIRVGEKLKTKDESNFGEVMTVDTLNGVIRVRKGPKMKDIHPTAVFRYNDVNDDIKEEAIIRLAEWVIANGIDDDGAYRAGRDLLLGYPPRTDPAFVKAGSNFDIAMKWVHALQHGVLPIQGPPGAGKSYTAAHMIVSLVRAGKKVGITACSHKVIHGLMQKVIRVAEEEGIHFNCMVKVSDIITPMHPRLVQTTDNEQVQQALNAGEVKVGGGTAWLWARENFMEVVDVLFVDEAGQLSLIDTLAISHAAKNIVLLGDPQQLKQPQQGSHPEGTEVSALEHILQEHKTIPAECGIFLDKTWRLHPRICTFISQLFYEDRLSPVDGLEKQLIDGNTTFKNAGLWYLPVHHEGNQSSSQEEVARTVEMIGELTKGDVYWTDKKDNRHVVTLSDILVITPYNAQVVALLSKLPEGAHVGTVDKFQGQEAPVVIYSMCSSSPEDAPRGMEFLYSLNRLNVAVSRAKSICILVASPELFRPDCKSPAQMRLANAFCRYLELSERLLPKAI